LARPTCGKRGDQGNQKVEDLKILCDQSCFSPPRKSFMIKAFFSS
jgi:hypothetical protein